MTGSVCEQPVQPAAECMAVRVCAWHTPPQPVDSCECPESRRHPPCTRCGDRCGSQLEHVEANDRRPWSTCSGCAVIIDGGW